jgi:hypothetical protein
LVSDDAVLVLGGFGDLALQNIDYVALNPAYAELYPPEPYVFRRLPTPSLAKWGFTATRLESGKVLILGGTVDGTNRYGQPVDTAYLLDPADGSVETVAPLQFARSDHTATLLGDGRVLVLGGRGADGNVVSTVEFWSDSN